MGHAYHEGAPPEPPERKGFWARFFKADPGESEVLLTDEPPSTPSDPRA